MKLVGQYLIPGSLLYLAAINLVTFGAFGLDKRAAVRGDWRVSEFTLLLLSAAGGIGGALWGQRRFRHKTKKQPFKSFLCGIGVLQLGGLAWLSARSLQIV